MDYVDKTLTCLQCGETFTFSASEQESFAAKGFANEPKRCPSCREARKQWRRRLDLDATLEALTRSGKYRVTPSVAGPEVRPIPSDNE